MIETIISSSVLILIILAIRVVFKGKINPMVQYGLWGLVGLRLTLFSFLELLPIESPLSVMNAVGSAEATIRGASDVEQVLAGNAEAKAIDNAVLIINNMKTGVMTSGEGISAAAAIDWQLVIMIVWAVGVAALASWLVLVNRRFGERIFQKRKLLMSVRADDADGLPTIVKKKPGHQAVDIAKAKLLPVYTVEGLDSPCLMGHKGEVAIYVPTEIAKDQEKLRFAIAHELCHYRHHDLVWAIIRGGMLAFYWFNPLVWLAAIMSKRDCELACDYGVLKKIANEDRLAYGRTLVDLIRRSDHKSGVFQMATTMYGSTNGIKERITLIAKNKKMKSTALVAVLLIAIFAVGCTFTSAPNNGDKKEIEAFAIEWADAFSERDAGTIHGLTESEELYLTIGGITENGEYWMGWSSPWPWDKDYVIDIEDDSTIHIYYYFRTSEPSIYVAKETIKVKKIEDTYKATDVSMKHFDSIESKAEFDEAYTLGFPDFEEFGTTYQAQADKNAWNMTAILKNPASAAMHQLNIKGAKVSGTYVDKYTNPPMAIVKFEFEDGEVEVNLIQPTFTDESGAKRQASVWVVVNEGDDEKTEKSVNKEQDNSKHFKQVSAYMEEQSKNTFSPYYELLDFQISNYNEKTVNGKTEATFQYKIVSKNYDRDPDTVQYIKEAKEKGNKNYQQMYDEYLQPRDMNFELKVVIDKNDRITLYSNISPKGVEWEETKMSDYILK